MHFHLVCSFLYALIGYVFKMKCYLYMYHLHLRMGRGQQKEGGRVIDVSNIKTLPHLGNRVKDSLIRRDVSGGRDGAPLSPGVGHNLRTESD